MISFVINTEKILRVAEFLERYVHKTPIMTSSRLNNLVKADLFFKCENLQKTGSFKVRGATYAIHNTISQKQKRYNLVTHSSGNHGQAVAYLAQTLGVVAYIVMPKNTPKIKVDAVKSYGGQIIFCEPNYQSRENTCKEVQDRTEALFIHAFDDYDTILGQSSVGKEFFDQVPDLDVIIAPVGGGGLLGGVSLSGYFLSSNTKIYGVEPLKANDTFLSFRAGRIVPFKKVPQSISDGLLAPVGKKNFNIIKRFTSDILIVSEPEIVNAMILIWENLKLVIEPSAATVLAAVLAYRNIFQGKKVGLVLSGGNIDINKINEYTNILNS